jgi:chemosensory pili system protein ChpA (sensor histidine kinase/response regulator)
LSRNKVLLVEDQAVIRNLLTFLLKQEGVAVDIAENGLVAYEKMRKSNDYKLIILDIDLPYMTGWELCEALHAMPETEHVPLIINSSERIIGRLELQKRYGILFFADKSNPMELVTEVLYLLGLGQNEYLEKAS